MASPRALTTATTVEFHTCITGLLENWKSSDSKPVEFSIPGLCYLPEEQQQVIYNDNNNYREPNTIFKVVSMVDDRYGPEEQCFIRLKSGYINDWLRGKWIAEVEFGTINGGGYSCFKRRVWSASDARRSRQSYGKTSVVSRLLSDAAIPDELHIRMRLTRTTPLATRGPPSFPRELEMLRTSVNRLGPALSLLDRPSIDITRIRFKQSYGVFEYLFVPSHILLKYGYFRACHDSGFSETEVQPMEISEPVKETENLSVEKDSEVKIVSTSEGKGSTSSDVKQVSESDKGPTSDIKKVSMSSDESLDSDEDSDSDEDEDEDSCKDSDSDANSEWEFGWDDDEYEHSVDHKFKATIDVKDISRRTYKAFIQWALCGALHFAPCRADYLTYVKSSESSMVEDVLDWPDWADLHSTTINNFGNLKTLSSPRSLYRLADKLLISDLKVLCRKQINENFKVNTIIQEIQHFQDYPEELLKDAYEYVKNNWDLVVQQDNFFSIISNCPIFAQKMFHQTILTKLSPSK